MQLTFRVIHQPHLPHDQLGSIDGTEMVACLCEGKPRQH
jgi:hypothetical protein